MFPLLFLVIFTTLLGNDEVQIGVSTINSSTYYVASMAAFGLISACYTNIAIQMIFARENGVLKRTRGTPLPAWSYLSARVVHALARRVPAGGDHASCSASSSTTRASRPGWTWSGSR